MSDPEDQTADTDSGDPDDDGRLCCDFCGEPSESVRRVALDGSYERLRTRHQAQYACPRCSERKDRERTETDRR